MDLEKFNPDSISPEALKISDERWNKYMEMFQQFAEFHGFFAAGK